MKKYAIVCTMVFLVLFTAGAQNGQNTVSREYSFNIFPGTLDLFTMEQMNEDYLSLDRLLARGINAAFDGKKLWGMPVGNIVNFIWPELTTAVTHEEGHRSILTNQGTGSISQPFYNLKGAAYVRGVTDTTLEGFRSSDLPSFIRMYTAGIESDYMMTRRSEQLAAFGQEDTFVLYPDFIRRISQVSSYMLESFEYSFIEQELGSDFVEKYLNLAEEDDELERDIVGMDTFGAVHWMFNPDAEYKRYVQWTDLTSEEKDFLLYRMGLRSLINYVNPFIATKPYFRLLDTMTITGSAGYCLAPFGDFIDENVYFTYNKFHLSFYAREYENYDTWFPAFGVSLCDYKPLNWLSFTISGHFWMEPENLGFYATNGVPGGAVKVKASFFVPFSASVRAVSFDMSAMYKTAGYLPEVESHKQLFRITCGTTVRF
jgi:hypothetical protein